MINEAIPIIQNVPGQNLHPVLLAKSQAKEATGFIMVAYDFPANDLPQQGECVIRGRKFYDLFFFEGVTIYECARLNQDLRFILNENTALQTFDAHKNDSLTSVSLFQSPAIHILRFRSTFYYEPCLKVQIGTLSKNQIATLLRSSRCRHGIIECNEFAGGVPAIHLSEIRSEEELAGYRATLKHGRMLLYDIDKNMEIIQERYFNSVTAQRLDPPAGTGEKAETAVQKRTTRRSRKVAAGSNTAISSSKAQKEVQSKLQYVSILERFF